MVLAQGDAPPRRRLLLWDTAVPGQGGIGIEELGQKEVRKCLSPPYPITATSSHIIFIALAISFKFPGPPGGFRPVH